MAFGEASAQPTVTQVSPPFLAEFPGVQGGRGWLSFRQQSPLSPQLEECPAPPPAPTPIHICYPDPCVHCRGPRPNTGSALSLQNSPDPLWGGRAPLPLRNSPPTTSMSRHTHTRPHTCIHTHTHNPQTAQPWVSALSPVRCLAPKAIWLQRASAPPHLGCSCAFALDDVFKNILTWQNDRVTAPPTPAPLFEGGWGLVQGTHRLWRDPLRSLARGHEDCGLPGGGRALCTDENTEAWRGGLER